MSLHYYQSLAPDGFFQYPLGWYNYKLYEPCFSVANLGLIQLVIKSNWHILYKMFLTSGVFIARVHFICLDDHYCWDNFFSYFLVVCNV